jgi:hypothetical protein
MKFKILLSLMAMAIAFSYATPAAAQGAYPTLKCDACRNPRIHYRDYRNFAYNQIFSPGGWMTYGDADIFRVVNSRGQSVVVDINLRMEVLRIDLGFRIPLPIPISIQVQIILIYENGDRIMSMIDPRAFPDGLPMPTSRSGPNRRGGAAGRFPSGGGGRSGSGREYSIPPNRGHRRCGIARVDNGPGRRTCI